MLRVLPSSDARNSAYMKLVGFSLACAPVRCAHPSFWINCYAKRGAARPPAHRSFAVPSGEYSSIE
jgi:hypothetical protein